MGVDAASRKWIGTKKGKQRVSTLRNHTLAQRRAIRSGNPTMEELLECIDSQWCWWCNSGPWICLSQHTSKAHGILASDIREMAHLIKRAVICSPEHSFACVVRLQHLLEKGQLERPKGESVPHVLSTRGREHSSEQGKKMLSDSRFINGAKLHHENAKKPHPCPICGKIIPAAQPVHCSEECTKAARSRERGPNPKLSATRKRLFATGQLVAYNPFPPKSHNCPICGTFIRRSHPVTCSIECAKALTRQKVAKPHPCPVCGIIIPKAHPITCSPACRKVIRQRTAVISAATRLRRRTLSKKVSV